MPETARDQLEPRIRQIAFFLPNRVGALRRALHLLEERGVKIGGVVILDAADHAVVRIVVDKPDGALEALVAEGYGGCLTEVLGVAFPPGPRFGIQRVFAQLLGAEVNVEYAYALMMQADGNPILALQADDLTMAARVLRHNGYVLVGQDQLSWPADA
jgi:hypothetical protein